jgi:hypothetical protein
VKVNALPERVEMMMNFRIDFASSIKESRSPSSRIMIVVLTLRRQLKSTYPAQLPALRNATT